MLWALILTVHGTAYAQGTSIEYVHGSGLQLPKGKLPYEESFKIRGAATLGGDSIRMVVLTISDVQNAKYQGKLDAAFEKTSNVGVTETEVQSIKSKYLDSPVSLTAAELDYLKKANKMEAKPRIRGLRSLMYEKEYHWVNDGKSSQFELLISSPLAYGREYTVEFQFLTDGSMPQTLQSDNDKVKLTDALTNQTMVVFEKAYQHYVSINHLHESVVKQLLTEAYENELLNYNSESLPKPFDKFLPQLSGQISTTVKGNLGETNSALQTLKNVILIEAMRRRTVEDFVNHVSEINRQWGQIHNVPAVVPHQAIIQSILNSFTDISSFDQASYNASIGEASTIAAFRSLPPALMGLIYQAGSEASTLVRDPVYSGLITSGITIQNLPNVLNGQIHNNLTAALNAFVSNCTPSFMVAADARSSAAVSSEESDNDARRLATDLTLFAFNFISDENGEYQDVAFTLMGGAKIYFFPVAKAQNKVYQGWSNFSEKRMSFVTGVMLSTLYNRGQSMESLLPNSDINLRLYTGLGYDINKYVAFYVGASFFRQSSPDPLLEKSRFAAAPFVALSIQTDLLSLLNKK